MHDVTVLCSFLAIVVFSAKCLTWSHSSASYFEETEKLLSGFFCSIFVDRTLDVGADTPLPIPANALGGTADIGGNPELLKDDDDET